MRIKSLQLENIRSHSKTTIPFVAGFNCLVGGVGRGKSSVLYAIDFALFGDPLGRSYEYLLRERADAGKIVIQFVNGGKTYTIFRGLRRHEKGTSQDMEQLKFFENDKLVASAKNEAVTEQLKALTGLDKDLFREIVWVRQEHLKELLDVAPRQRQTKLDQLFGLSDYEVAWSSLATFQRDYKVEKGVYERDADVVGVDKLQAEYNKAVEEFSSIENQLQNLGKELSQAESALKEATSRLENLEELRKKTEELREKEIQLQTNIANIEDISAKLADENEKKKSLIHELEERLKLMEMQENSHRNKLQEAELKSDQTIEELRKYLFTIEDQMASIGSEQEATKREIQTSQNRISSLATENKCPLCLQNLTGDYKKGLLERLHEENAEHEKRLLELQKNLDELEGLHSVVDLVVSNLQALVPRIEEIKGRVAEEREFLNKLSAEFEDAQQQEKRLRGQLSATRAEITKFDVTDLESTRKLRDAAFEQYSATKSRLEMMERSKGDIALRMDDLKERLDHAQQKIEKMEKIEKLLEVIDGIRGAYRSIQPKLRSEFVMYLQRTVQQELDELVGYAGPTLTVKIDETYTPFVSGEGGYEREVSNLSGGERTLLAFAYRIGLGQLIMQSRTGHGLYMLLLDEPTESLGREDGSVDRLAEAISRLKAIEQIIAVTHSEAFAEKAEHVIRVEKEAGASRVSVES
ncbi:MAG: DNA double-strand break repair Rad50 ATPase [Candidatus Bathyarchaeota archaeon BA2]|nr:MAG: DNA double-strand break repair Rad50 ATPase [Candidatus Bathyarchaeota archaeon BA2]